MVQKLLFSIKLNFPFYLSFLFVFLFFENANAQCAGTDNTLTVCDITNAGSQSIDLNLLLGTYTAGGTWVDVDGSEGLDTATGILNAQKVFKSGVYHYTYTVDNVVGCLDNSAEITVTIGGYSGIPGPNNSICSSDSAYSLFQVFQGTPVLAPQSGGIWNDDNNSGGLNSATGVLDASIPVTGRSYSYTYTIAAIGSCPQVSSQVSVSIYRSPKPGSPTNLSLCSNQVSSYQNLDLNNQLSGEDAGGVWTEFATTEISDSGDSTINVQNIYDTFGPGRYRFTYTVSPPKDDRVCTDQSSFVDILIGEQLDFTGATFTISPDNVCENEIQRTTYTGILTQGIKPIANGSYRVNYTIDGVGSFTTTQSFSSGVLIFPIPSLSFSSIRDYTIRINNVTLTSSLVSCASIVGALEDVLHISQSPKIDAATLTIAPVCQGANATVSFSGTSNLVDGNYDIVYNLSGNNVLNGIPATMNVVSGVSSFTIPAPYIPKTGTSTITITKITNATTGCSNTSILKSDFIINDTLDLNNLGIQVNDSCQNQSAEVTLSGLGALTSIDVNYYLSGSNTISPKTISLIASAGQGTFLIPGSDLQNAGTTTLVVNNIVNTVTGCIFTTNNKNGSFTVISGPNTPITEDNQLFCEPDNPTVANLTPQGNQYQWFDSATSTEPLVSTTALRSGTYFVKEVDATNGCSSALKMITASINPIPQIDSARLSIATTCQSYNVTVLLGGSSNLTNGLYAILYNLSGDNTGTDLEAELTVTNGVGFFIIPATIAPNAGSTTVSITNIKNVATGCSNSANLSRSFTTNPMPDISNLLITINDVCIGGGTNVELSGLNNLSRINVNYQLLGANTFALKTIALNLIDGKATIVIPATDLANIGLTTFNITNITNTNTGCPIVMDHKTDFAVNSLPDVSNIIVNVNNGCLNQSLNATISGLGALSEIIIDYTISGANAISTQTPILSVVGGNANFEIPGSVLTSTGVNTLTITNLTNASTGCSSVVNSNFQDFEIFSIPNNPIASNQEFCKENLATVSSLIPNGSGYNWYDSVNSTTPLNADSLLVTGTYYLKETNLTTGCESNATSVNILINATPTPVLNSDGQNFCGADKPTIQNLTSNINYTGTLTWYDAPVNGMVLSNSDLLVEGQSYYGFDFNSTTQCTSDPLEVMVTLKSCNVVPDGLFIPDAFSPNGDGVNDTFVIKDIEFLFPNFTLEIFNRYGNVLFKGNINKPAWDGKNSNSSFIDGDAATGVYFYIINYNKENFKPRQGQLYLNR
ncbi:gliding motility-associated C-terminal domain-containing protein [Flavobacterium adhaerens]|uniref:gliding motility-associated C-terminal domain-containing protein n=1 Tax=Flavobacterium adhaerens TaxID=3149043 RepID=UPI0032B5C3E9